MTNDGWIIRGIDSVRLRLKVTPRAARNLIQGVERDAGGTAHLAVRVTAPPQDGKANVAVLRLLADRLDLPASRLRIVAGAAARRKTVAIEGTADQLLSKLRALASGAGSA